MTRLREFKKKQNKTKTNARFYPFESSHMEMRYAEAAAPIIYKAKIIINTLILSRSGSHRNVPIM